MKIKTGHCTTFLYHVGFTNRKQIFLLIIVILTCVTGDVVVEQQQIMVNEGSSVTLKCSVNSDDNPNVSWYFNGNELNANLEVEEEGQIVAKYTLTSVLSEATRTYNLKIRHVLSTDDGVYTCRFIFAEGRMITHKIILAVKYLQENPSVDCQLVTANTSSQHGSNHQMESTREPTQHFYISCDAYIGRNVFVNITIMKSVPQKNDQILVHFFTKEQSNAVDGVNVNYPVNITDLDGWQFWCVAHQSMMLGPVNSCTPILKKPQVKIIPLKNNSNQYKCEVESYPDVTFFRWMICEKEIGNAPFEECKVLNSTDSNVTLMDIGDVDDELILICESQNAVGTGQGNLTITHTKPTGMPFTENTESTDINNKPTDMPTTLLTATTKNRMRLDSHLVNWSVAGGFVLLFGLALTIISFYLGNRSSYITRYLTQETQIKKVRKSNAQENVEAAASPDATTVKMKCTSDDYHSESKYLCQSSESKDETQPPRITHGNPN